MKIARVIPIFKHGLKTQTENYRPISLLNVICKLLVKTIYTRVYSYLGPLLFLIYINDIQNSGQYDNLNLFADDTSLFMYNKNINQLYEKCNIAINHANLWFQANKLNLNLLKCNYSVFGSLSNVKTQNLPMTIRHLFMAFIYLPNA